MPRRELALKATGDRKLAWGVAAMPLAGEAVSGDLHVVRDFPGGVLVAVIDALGHGREASAAAHLAADTLERHAGDDPRELLLRCNRVLHGSRGAVISLASINWREDVMTWIGVGDVAGVLTASDAPGHLTNREAALLTRGGILGVGNDPNPRPWVIPLAEGDTLVIATDGVDRAFTSRRSAFLTPQQIADELLRVYRKGTDDALVLVARYPGDGEAP